MSVIEKMIELVERAEKGELAYIGEARNVLANALIEKIDIDEEDLFRIFSRATRNALNGGREAVLAWSPLATACIDYIDYRQVAMDDGRCATEDGWDYPNLPPENRGQ